MDTLFWVLLFLHMHLICAHNYKISAYKSCTKALNHYSFGTQIQIYICVNKCEWKMKKNQRKSGAEYQIKDHAAEQILLFPH